MCQADPADCPTYPLDWQALGPIGDSDSRQHEPIRSGRGVIHDFIYRSSVAITAAVEATKKSELDIRRFVGTTHVLLIKPTLPLVCVCSVASFLMVQFWFSAGFFFAQRNILKTDVWKLLKLTHKTCLNKKSLWNGWHLMHSLLVALFFVSIHQALLWPLQLAAFSDFGLFASCLRRHGANICHCYTAKAPDPQADGYFQHSGHTAVRGRGTICLYWWREGKFCST